MFLDVENPSSADIHKAADYIFHVAEIAGWDHVGVGSDFDGTDNVPIGLEPKLATDEQIWKFAGENILRVWTEAESFSQVLKSAGEKSTEETWLGRKWTRAYLSMPFMFMTARATESPEKRIPEGMNW
ncbi:membrane dipeptidase [[Emmonsia] crescens]|uniref:Dipeptidase n=1 Tax=[Emmonsia] crescens TaxID=73230 RepID=A0A2B7ZIT2_9EURO|nr:membrane dipeptidase [Emmonsia crescens]